MQVAVIANAGAGAIGAFQHEGGLEALQSLFRASGVDAELILREPAGLTEAARTVSRRGVDAVVAAGGDGTVNAVANGLIGTDVPLAVVPLGTLNHFARDLGLPAEVADVVRVIATGRRRWIDVGEVNGRIFVNNSSIGLYPEIVNHREAERRRTGRGKWLSMLIAFGRVLRRFPLLLVRVETAGQTLVTRTPFLFVGNNDYGTSLPTLGQRAVLDAGRLSLYTVRCRSRLRLFSILLRAVVGRTQAVRELAAGAVTDAWVTLRRRELAVAVDGEVVRMTSPLHYRIRPGALRVVVPSEG